MKKLIAFMLTIVLALTMGVMATGCNKKEIIIVGYTLYEPMNYEEDGKLVGFDTELAQKTFSDLGYNVRFRLIEWNNKYIELNSGTINCIWNGFTSNSADDGVARADRVDFTYNYMTNAQCVIRKNTTTELTDATQFDGKSVAFESGSAGQGYVDGLTGTINKKGVLSQMEAVNQVNSGMSQYAVIDILLAQSLLGKGNFANLVINEGITIDAEYYAIGFKKGSDLTAKVNAKLVEYADNGYLLDLAEKYGLETKVILDFSSQMA